MLKADAIGGMAWAPDPMKSVAPVAATEQKIDRMVLSDRNEGTKSAGILSENGGEASPSVTDSSDVANRSGDLRGRRAGAWIASTAQG